MSYGAMSPLGMFSIDLSPATGRDSSSKIWKVSVTASRAPSEDDNLTDWRSAIASQHKAEKELEARRKAQPDPLIPSCSVNGFVDAALARDKTSGSSNLEGASDCSEHVNTRPVRRALLTQDSLDEIKLEDRRRKLSDAADESQGLSLGLEPAQTQLMGPTINLAASLKDTSLRFEALQETEVTAVFHAQPSAQACNMNEETQHQDDEASGSQALQLQNAATSSSPAQPSRALLSSSFSSSPEMLRLPSFSTHIPVSTIDRLLNGGTSATETCSRRKSKSPPLPRVKSTRSRQTKKTAAALCQPMLSRTCSAHAPYAADASDAHTHSYVPLQDVDHQPSCGVRQKISSSLSAIWRWLCKFGGDFIKLGRKVRKKLMTALGLGQEEMQSLLAVQQAEEREALSVGAYRPMHHVEEPPNPPRLQRWRT